MEKCNETKKLLENKQSSAFDTNVGFLTGHSLVQLQPPDWTHKNSARRTRFPSLLLVTTPAVPIPEKCSQPHGNCSEAPTTTSSISSDPISLDDYNIDLAQEILKE